MNAEMNKVRRLPQRGHYDRETIYAILDAAKVCHVGFVEDGWPFVIPMLYARTGNELVLHGAPASRLLKHIAAGRPLCVSVAILDGLVLARSAFHHSVNYRSVVLFGCGRSIEDPEKKIEALRLLTEHLTPGRWAAVRPPNAAELKGTTVVAVAIERASAKIRSGPPADDEEDQTWPVWAGVVPVHEAFGTPIPAGYGNDTFPPPTL